MKENEISGFVGVAPGCFWSALFKVNEIISRIDKEKYIVETWRDKHPIIEGHEALFYRATLISEEQAFNWFAECCPTFYRLWNDIKRIIR